MDFNLHEKHCVPCEGNESPMSEEEARKFFSLLEHDWKLSDSALQLEREYVFGNFAEAIRFINNVADIAESEGHHPDFLLHHWNHVTIQLATHAIHGLSLNDFILASKIDDLVRRDFSQKG